MFDHLKKKINTNFLLSMKRKEDPYPNNMNLPSPYLKFIEGCFQLSHKYSFLHR